MLFKEIIGQETVKQRLVQTVKDNRISHAQLFLGPEGSGSLALAVSYAQYINCLDKKENDSCGECISCIKFNKLVHPDIHFVYPIALSKEVRTSNDVLVKWREAFLENPYLNLFNWFEYLDAENKQAVIGTDESMEIIRKLSFTTYESEFKIMIIWMPEKMNPTAANKLLKILEEPPDKTLFLLVCENEDQLLRTILSRTQLVKINKIPDHLMRLALTERNSIEDTLATGIVHLADGNYNAAIHLINDNEQAQQNFASFKQWMRLCLHFDAPKIISWVDDISASSVGRERQKNFLAYSIHMVRECLMLNYGELELVRLEGEELEFVKKFAPFINGSNCEEFTEELNKASYHIERNASPKILFMDLSFRVNELLNKQAIAK